MGRWCTGSKSPMPVVPVSLIILLSLLALLGAQATGAVAGCPGCARPKSADSIRLDAIKWQILTKLGLKDKPQVKRTLPREMVLASLSRAGELPLSPQQDPLSSSTSQYYYPSSSSFSSSSHSSAQDDAYADYDDFYGRTSEIITFAEQGS